MKLTITDYAHRAGITRDTIYKRMKHNRKFPDGVKVIKVAGQNFMSLTEAALEELNKKDLV